MTFIPNNNMKKTITYYRIIPQKKKNHNGQILAPQVQRAYRKGKEPF